MSLLSLKKNYIESKRIIYDLQATESGIYERRPQIADAAAAVAAAAIAAAAAAPLYYLLLLEAPFTATAAVAAAGL